MKLEELLKDNEPPADFYDAYQDLAGAVFKRANEDWHNPLCLQLNKGEQPPTHKEILEFIDSPAFELFCLTISMEADIEDMRKKFKTALKYKQRRYLGRWKL